MSLYDPDKFADWLSNGFDSSSFKSFSALADKAGLSRSSVSALANAKKQPLTNKPSQPKADTVIKLAEAMGKNVDEALLLAGHAPLNKTKKPTNVRELFELLDSVGLEVHFDGGMDNLEHLGEEDLQELLDSIIANASAKAKRAYKNLQN